MPRRPDTSVISSETDIKPLFRQGDRESMESHFDLWDLDDVRENSEAILTELEGGGMPCDGAWPQEWVGVFERWTQTGLSG